MTSATSRAASREVMIREHLMARGIRDPQVLKAMREVPREVFVPEGEEPYAYEDHPLPIGEGQTISQPYIVAYMTEALELLPEDRVLEVGTGSGYAAAILSRIVSRVFTVERIPALAHKARQRLHLLGYDNIEVFDGDGSLGWPDHAPYNAIIATAGAPEVPRPLLQQLAAGGRLVIPVGATQTLQVLVRVRHAGSGEYQFDELCPVRFVPLIGVGGW